MSFGGGGSGGGSIGSDSDVSLGTLTDGQVLTYNDTTKKWNNIAPAVQSVNGKTGAVVIGESDISGLSSDLAAKYVKPGTGIPKTDLASAVQTSLGKADSALQSAPVSSVNSKTGAVSLAATDVSAVPLSSGGQVMRVVGYGTSLPTSGQAGDIFFLQSS